MSAPVVFFLRHGETEGGPRYWGRTNVALSAEGFRQMRAATASLHIDHIATSPLRRCRIFSEELSARLGLRMAIEPRFAEMDFGRWNGRAATEILVDDADALHRFWHDPVRHAPSGGETLDAFAARVQGAFRDLVEHGPKGSILTVTHGGPIRILLCLAQGLRFGRLFDVDVPHASLHRLSAQQCTQLCSPAAIDP